MDAQKIRYYSKIIEMRREITPDEKAELIDYLRPYVLQCMERCNNTHYLIRLLQETWQNNNRKY